MFRAVHPEHVFFCMGMAAGLLHRKPCNRMESSNASPGMQETDAWTEGWVGTGCSIVVPPPSAPFDVSFLRSCLAGNGNSTATKPFCARQHGGVRC